MGRLAFFALVLTGIVWLTQALQLLDLIVNRGQSGGIFLNLAAYMMPSVLAIVIPIAFFCALLYALNRMKGESELIIYFSTGLSRWAVARPVMMVASIVALLVLALNLWLTPIGLRALQASVFELREDLAGAILTDGTFNVPVAGLTVFIRERVSASELNGIMVHDNRDRSAPVTYMAEQGSLVRTQDGAQLIMVNGNLQQKGEKPGAISVLYFDKYSFDLSEFTQITNVIAYKPNQRPFMELLDPDTHANSERDAQKFVKELHTRISTPFIVFTYAAIVLAALVGGPFRRRGAGWRITYAIIAALVMRLGALAITNALPSSPGLVPILYIWIVLWTGGALAFLSDLSALKERISPQVAVEG